MDKYGELGHCLADSLPCFSLDIVKIVAAFTICHKPTIGDSSPPKIIATLDVFDSHDFAVTPDGHVFNLPRDNRLDIYKPLGECFKTIHLKKHSSAIIALPDNTVIVRAPGEGNFNHTITQYSTMGRKLKTWHLRDFWVYYSRMQFFDDILYIYFKGEENAVIVSFSLTTGTQLSRVFLPVCSSCDSRLVHNFHIRDGRIYTATCDGILQYDLQGKLLARTEHSRQNLTCECSLVVDGFHNVITLNDGFLQIYEMKNQEAMRLVNFSVINTIARLWIDECNRVYVLSTHGEVSHRITVYGYI